MHPGTLALLSMATVYPVQPDHHEVPVLKQLMRRIILTFTTSQGCNYILPLRP